ncbi:sulfotransferase family 2 domain-containing protein [Teredinibacter sp. KSP-S5-2]|uniref:sulfotransferase family 2 domain-containing protein n=1 Tax=Teredinibacter sp. KSP-S5-2 TaxID=3034506 RepID=UPI0029350C1D|nr:sulfotransferase family 2 domain-containing protein [Teredinibacter sp. KSP-S5-2]WNO08118.1 sulfotransferase family 2 domain-containing protein [Teredinibacter sp. KSP-S5-2]
MLLSHKYNFLFVHIAKTGGTSVRAALNTLRWKDPMYYLMWPAHKISGLTGHKLGMKFPRHSHIIAAKEMLPEEFFNQLYKFAFVRNPWDLQVSSFHHIQRERPQFMNGITDFNEFMRWKFNPERPYQYHIDTSLSLQSDYLVDLHGNSQMDFIGRYERIEEDFKAVCDHIGVSISLPHKRKGKRGKDYREYFADDTAEMVAKHFAKDIEMLAYNYDQPNV